MLDSHVSNSHAHAHTYVACPGAESGTETGSPHDPQPYKLANRTLNWDVNAVCLVAPEPYSKKMLFGTVKGKVGSVDVMTPGPLGKVPLVLLATVQLVIDASRYMIWKDVTADAKDPEQKPKQGMFQDRVNTPCKLLKQSKFCKKSPLQTEQCF